jgi:thiol-disulfide isomerase/thioredoxin
MSPSAKGFVMRLIILLLLTFSSPAFCALAPSFGNSIAFSKLEESVQLANLRGKVVVTLFYQSWCPICNKWAPELVKQLQEQYAGKPGYVLLGLKTDGGSPSEAKDFLAGKGADVSQWIVACDEEQAYYEQVIKDTPLWGFAVINPDGEIIDKGKSGSYFTGGNSKVFVLPSKRKEFDKTFSQSMSFNLPTDKTYPSELTQAVYLAESGRFLSALNSAREVGGIPAKDFEADLMLHLDKRVSQLNEQSCDADNSERYFAFMTLRDIAINMKSLPPGIAAKKMISEISKDDAIKREQKSEKSWLSLLAAVNKQAPENRKAALAANVPAFIKAFDGTYFARVAQSSGK